MGGTHLVGSRLRGLGASALAALLSATAARADQLDAEYCRTECARLEALGFVPVPAYAAAAGSIGRLELREARDPGLYEAARVDAKGASVWGVLGWCRDCSLPVRANSVFFNVGDAGTPLLMGGVRLARGEYARLADGGVQRLSLDADADPAAGAGAATEVVERPLPDELLDWTISQRTLIAFEVPWPAEEKVALDRYVLRRGGSKIATCRGLLVLDGSLNGVIGRTRIVRTSGLLPILGLRHAGSFPDELVHASTSDTDVCLLTCNQLVVAARMTVSQSGAGRQLIESSDVLRLLGPDGHVTTVKNSEGDRRPGLLGDDPGCLILLFAVPDAAGGAFTLDHGGQPIARYGDSDEILDAELAALAGGAGSTAAAPPPTVEEPPADEWPGFQESIRSGRNRLTLVNNGSCGVRVGLRTPGGRGRDVLVPANGNRTTELADGTYDLFLRYDNEPASVYQGDPVYVMNSVSTLTLGASYGNYRVKRL